MRQPLRLGILGCGLVLVFTACADSVAVPPLPPTPIILPTIMTTPTPTVASLAATTNQKNVIPKPVSVTTADGVFLLNDKTSIVVEPNNDQVARLGQYLAETLRPATGFPQPVTSVAESTGAIFLQLVADETLGEEGYTLTVAPNGVKIEAQHPAGLFYGIQTLRQLLPAAIESGTVQNTPWELAAGTVRDTPRFEWRGTMLDVSRHFFTVEDVKRYIDLASFYKLNRLHLHLSDDQGWRIEIKSWDKLATHGGSTKVGGGPGGYYTQDDYREIVEHAADHFMTVVPEIDMPGHTSAALASYPELNCDDKVPELYTGTEVGFSTLCVQKELTYKFLGDVIKELAAITPGPYLHIGGDEAQATTDSDYVHFIERVQEIVQANGKQLIGWEEIAQVELLPNSITQHWHGTGAAQAVEQGERVLISPASKAYLDMKYDDSTKLGLNWAGNIDVVTGYSWDPATEIQGVGEDDIVGVEAPLWSETLQTIADIEYMAFPRLLGIAEIGWSPREGRSWEEYRTRLGAQGARLKNLGVNFYRAPEVEWE